MKSVPLLFRIIYFLLFPVLLAYPNKLFEGLYINYAYIYVCYALILFNTLSVKKRGDRIVVFWAWLFIVVLFANIFSILSNNKVSVTDYVSSSFRYLSYFVLTLLLFKTTNNSSDLIFWIKSMLFGLFISLIIIILDSSRVGFIEHIYKMDTFESKGTLDIYFRAYGAYLSPVSAGIFLLNAIIMIYTTILYVSIGKKIKVLLYTIVTISVVCIFMTASRTALIGLIVFALLIVLKSKRRIRIFLLILFLITAIQMTGIIDTYVENILLRNERDSLISNNILEGSGRVDTLINSVRINYGWRTFLFGVGPSEYTTGDGFYSLAHNGFVSLILCYGLLGAILFYRVLVYIFRIVRRNHFLKLLYTFFIIVNSITFISSDGPVTHFWLINYICFMYFMFYYSYYRNELCIIHKI